MRVLLRLVCGVAVDMSLSSNNKTAYSPVARGPVPRVCSVVYRFYGGYSYLSVLTCLNTNFMR